MYLIKLYVIYKYNLPCRECINLCNYFILYTWHHRSHAIKMLINVTNTFLLKAEKKHLLFVKIIYQKTNLINDPNYQEKHPKKQAVNVSVLWKIVHQHILDDFTRNKRGTEVVYYLTEEGFCYLVIIINSSSSYDIISLIKLTLLQALCPELTHIGSN